LEPTKSQILGLTADNAANMDTLSKHLAEQVPGYSTVNRTRCFTHILNLVAKSLLRQFDVTKSKDSSNKDLSPEEEHLLALAEGIDDEELIMAQQDDANDMKIRQMMTTARVGLTR